MCEYDGPRKGPGLKEDVEMNWAKGSWCIRFRFCGKMSVDDRESWDASSSVESIIWEFEKGYAARD